MENEHLSLSAVLVSGAAWLPAGSPVRCAQAGPFAAAPTPTLVVFNYRCGLPTRPLAER